jgi:hypothetical protein
MKIMLPETLLQDWNAVSGDTGISKTQIATLVGEQL